MPARSLFAFLLGLAALLTPAARAEVTFQKNGVSVALTVEPAAGDTVEVVGVFTPEKREDPLHLYSIDLKEGDVGFPTRIDLAPGETATVAGPLKADKVAKVVDGVPVYPPGPVTVRLPVKPAAGAGPDTPLRLTLTYMACTEKSCLIPVIRAPLAVTLAGKAAPAAAAPAVANDPDEDEPEAVPEIAPGAPTTAFAHAIAEEVTRQLEQSREERRGIRWRHPKNVAELERTIREAHAAGKPAILDFTGPSCVNCQQMAKSVFRLPEVRDGWNRGVPIEVNTDPPHDDFAEYQQQTFQTQNRPFYAALAPDGRVEKWTTVFDPADRAKTAAFVTFLDGGPGSDEGTGSGLWEFFLLAILGGLFTLVMPCTYPMIPFTINVFTKQSNAGRPLVPLAAAYAFGIVAAFTGLGVVVTGVFGASIATLSGHPITNLVIGVAFVLLGLSLLDVFFLQIPTGFANSIGGARMGYAGALVMGLTFAVTAFTCTAPFAGSVLAQGVATGNWLMPTLGMAVYSGTIAIPFFAMGVAPGVIRKLPKADAWMHEFKVIGGLIEIGAAAKFLAIADAAWGWGLVRRGPVLAFWGAICALLALYVLGLLRFESDNKVEHVGPWRIMLATALVTLAFYLLHGLAGGHLGVIESFFPLDEPGGA